MDIASHRQANLLGGRIGQRNQMSIEHWVIQVNDAFGIPVSPSTAGQTDPHQVRVPMMGHLDKPQPNVNVLKARCNAVPIKVVSTPRPRSHE